MLIFLKNACSRMWDTVGDVYNRVNNRVNKAVYKLFLKRTISHNAQTMGQKF